jgi:hypothetical protein
MREASADPAAGLPAGLGAKKKPPDTSAVFGIVRSRGDQALFSFLLQILQTLDFFSLTVAS